MTLLLVAWHAKQFQEQSVPLNGHSIPSTLGHIARNLYCFECVKPCQCAVTRKSFDGTGPYLPSQAFTVLEAIDSYTKQGAYASFEEETKGRILPGYKADFVILENNPFEEDAEELHRIPVYATYVNGKKVHGKENHV